MKERQDSEEKVLEEKALAFLDRDLLSHVDMTEAIRRGYAKIYYAGEDGVAMEETKNHTRYLSVGSLEAGERILGQMEPEKPIIIHQEYMIEPAKRLLGMRGYNKCYQMAYLKKERALTGQKAEDGLVHGDIVFRQLSLEWVDKVSKVYHIMDEPDYIRLLLKEGVMYGAFIKDEIAGFIGIHSEGCMGLLEVLPQFRRRGIGEALERFMIDWNLDRGYLPFCQVFEDNEASLRLQEKLGLTMAEGFFWWMY